MSILPLTTRDAAPVKGTVLFDAEAGPSSESGVGGTVASSTPTTAATGKANGSRHFVSADDLSRRRSLYGSSSSSSGTPLFLKRILKVGQVDFEYGLWQMTYLCIAPRKVYRNVYYHKQTKNSWARDDPALMILLAMSLCITAAAWGFVYGDGVLGILKMMLWMVLQDFLLVGLVISTLLWFFTNRFLVGNPTVHTSEQNVEWAYAFDIHTNAFVPLFLILYVAQFMLISIIKRPYWISLFVGNTLYLAAAVYYVYITFLGYNALPFLIHTRILLYPLAPVILVYLGTLLGFNIGKSMLSLYFGK